MNNKIIECSKIIKLINLKKILKKTIKLSEDKGYNSKLDIINLLLKNKISLETIYLENILINIENIILKKNKTDKILIIKSKNKNNDSEEKYDIQNIKVKNNCITFEGNLIKNEIEEKTNVELSLKLNYIKGYYLLLDNYKDKDILYIYLYNYKEIPNFFINENRKLIISKETIKNIYDNIKDIITNEKCKKQYLRIYNNNKTNITKNLLIKEIIIFPDQYKIVMKIINKKYNNDPIQVFSINQLIGKYNLEVKDNILYINIYEYFPSLDKYNIDINTGELINN